MLKDLPSGLQMVMNGFIEQAVKNISNRGELSFFEKVNSAYNYVIDNSSFIEKDDNFKSEILEKIKELVTVVMVEVKVFEENYNPWLEDEKTLINWKHRDNYYKYLLLKKGWSNSVVQGSIDRTTDIILDHMANPRKNTKFSKKGLVIGDIQSGKTANYTGLINKAIDVGYKVIIVLAGQQNDLRSQTQERLDKEVLGYETNKNSSLISSGEKIGIGTLDFFTVDVDSLTSRGNSGDFKKKQGISRYGLDKPPVLAVVKKNTTVLKNLYEDFNQEINLKNGKLDVPVLIVDDEVDQASVNTKRDPEEDPTVINRHIRNIINLCDKVSYVGYTATPYANVLINYNNDHDIYGNDLFPKDFIVLLPTPKGYCGVDEFFGSKDEDNTYDLVQLIDDYDQLVDFELQDNIFKLKSSNEITNLSDSLKDAIDDYLVASAIRRSREGNVHNGMMIHLAAYKKPATSLTELMTTYVDDLKIEFRFDKEDLLERLRNVYLTRFKPISEKRGKTDSWENIKKELDSVFELLKVKLLNGDSKDIIDYSLSNQTQIIAIGGNKLSRGITIEGLMTSYYLRDSRAYDTTLQMGRWFGHKEKYLDLCRIYTQQDLINNFIHIMDATKLLRSEVTEMNDRNLTPKEFGLKIMSHSTMLPTARNKMYSAHKILVSYSGTRQETTHFNISKKESNFKITSDFVESLQIARLAQDKYVKSDNVEVNVFRDCPSYMVKKYFTEFYDTNDGKIKSWINYLDTLNPEGEIKNWTVVLSSVEGNRGNVNLGHLNIGKGRRTSLDGHSSRVVATADDFKYYFNDLEMQKKYSRYSSNDCELNVLFKKSDAILAIYVLDLSRPNKPDDIIEENVIGLGVWFPKTNNVKAKADYFVNEVFVDQLDMEEANGYED